MSYQKAVDVADELRRWPIGRGELHRWVRQEGAAFEAARAADTEALLGAHPDRDTRPRRCGTVWVSADGTMVHDRSTGTELEVKIGLIFDGTRRTGRNRRALTGRTLAQNPARERCLECRMLKAQKAARAPTASALDPRRSPLRNG